MINRHHVKRGQKVWVFINHEPHEIIFERLMSYKGFVERKVGDNSILEHPCDEAIFAETRQELIEDKVSKLNIEIIKLQTDREYFKSMLWSPNGEQTVAGAWRFDADEIFREPR